MRLIFLISILFCVAGCSGGDSGSKGGNDQVGPANGQPNTIQIGNTDSIADYNRAAWDAVCDVVFSCPNSVTLELIVSWYGRYGSAQDCKSAYGADAAAWMGDFLLESGAQEAVRAGRSEYSSEAGTECLRDWVDLACQADHEADETPYRCEAVLTPKQDLGEPCVESFIECRRGLACNAWSMDASCSGTCEEASSGTSCGDVECAVTEYCHHTGGVDPECRTRKTDGEACEPAQCERDSTCLGGDFDGNLGICVADRSIAEGEACDDETQCDFGLACVWDDDEADLGACTAISFAAAAGSSCVPTRLKLCAMGLACVLADGASNEYVCGSALPAGSRCTLDSQCQAGLHCEGGHVFDGEEGVCTAPDKALGESCEWHFECTSGLCERGDTGDFGDRVCVATDWTCSL